MATTVNIGTLIVTNPDVCGGRPRIAGKRFSVEQIATLTKEGLSPQQILQEYDRLELAEVHAALAYYYANQEEIDEHLALDRAEYNRLSNEN